MTPKKGAGEEGNRPKRHSKPDDFEVITSRFEKVAERLEHVAPALPPPPPPQPLPPINIPQHAVPIVTKSPTWRVVIERRIGKWLVAIVLVSLGVLLRDCAHRVGIPIPAFLWNPEAPTQPDLPRPKDASP